jgi:hypothetical protein
MSAEALWRTLQQTQCASQGRHRLPKGQQQEQQQLQQAVR